MAAKEKMCSPEEASKREHELGKKNPRSPEEIALIRERTKNRPALGGPTRTSAKK